MNKILMSSGLWVPRALGILIAIVALGCADVTIRKVPHAPSYDLQKTGPYSWNELQREGDDMEGVPYYLPRPWVSIKREFPVGGGTWHVWGQVSEDGSVVALLPLPPELKGRLQSSVPLTQIHGSPKNTGTGSGSEQSGGARGSGTQTETTSAKPRLQPDDASLLTVAFSPQANPAFPEEQIRITVKLKREDVKLASKGGVDNAKWMRDSLFLLPWSGGKANAEEAVQLKLVTKPADANKADPQEIVAYVTGKEVPQFAVVALALKATEDGAENTVFLHQPRYSMANVFAKVGDEKPGAVSGNNAGTKVEKKKEQTKPVSSASFTGSGDPLTSPLMKLDNQLFDVVMLPDTSEKYVVDVSGGLGIASSDIGLENGWMVERMTSHVDSREMGRFVMASVGKIVDVGVAAISPAKAAADAAAELPTLMPGDLGTPSPEQGGVSAEERWVLLAIHHIEFAVPGLYPIAKPRELQQALRDSKGKTVGPSGALEWRAPRVLYERRSETTIALISVSKQKPRSANAQPGPEFLKVVQFLKRFVASDEGKAKLKAKMAATVDTLPADQQMSFKAGRITQIQGWKIPLVCTTPNSLDLDEASKMAAQSALAKLLAEEVKAEVGLESVDMSNLKVVLSVRQGNP